MNWIFFTLVSRGLWAADNIVDKLLIGKYLKDSVVLTLIAGIAPLFLSIAIIIFNGLGLVGLKQALLAIFAGTIQILAVFAFYQAIEKEEISRVIPLFQLTPPFVLIFSFLFLGEVLIINYYFAFVLILVGGFLISLQRIEGVFKLRNAFWWIALSSLIYAVQIVILKSLYVAHPFWDITVYVGFGEFLPTIILLLLISDYRGKFVRSLSGLNPSGWTLLILGKFFVAIATLSGFWALTTGPVSLISVFRGFQSVFVLIYAILFSIWLPKILKEELSKSTLGIKAIAILLMMSGLYLIYK